MATAATEARMLAFRNWGTGVVDENKAGWTGDVLNRRPVGDFLYRLVMSRYGSYHATTDAGALCVAIDGDWGVGKTFFVDRWSQDVATQDHIVLKFDAWENDLADDPLIGFMAQLKAGLESHWKRLPVAKRAPARKQLNEMIRHAGRAVFPVASVLGRAAVKKAIGAELSELMDAAHQSSPEADGSAASETRTKLSDTAIDAFFESALKTHTDRREAIVSLKDRIARLLRYLDDNSKLQRPLFVVVDELDRCRPDYAIRFLEGVKHLFDAQGLVFVFSTNLKQLGASAKALYGDGFDGERYLRRFFHFSYSLPAPDHDAFALFVSANGSTLAQSRSIEGALQYTTGAGPIDILAMNFAAVSRAFDLDLRSQRQVFWRAEVAATGLPSAEPLFCFYLFFLTVMYFRAPDRFEQLRTIVNLADVTTLAVQAGARSTTTTFSAKYPDKEERKVDLLDIFALYHHLAMSTMTGLNRWSQGDHETLPQSLMRAVMNRRPFGEHVCITKYMNLVRDAGRVN